MSLPLIMYPKSVREFIGVGQTKFYQLAALEDFPKPRSLDGKTNVYLTKEIEDWIENREKVQAT